MAPKFNRLRFDKAKGVAVKMERCRNILQQMAADGGQAVGDSLESFTLADVLNNIISNYSFFVYSNTRFETH